MHDFTDENWTLIRTDKDELAPRIYPCIAVLQQSSTIVVMGGYVGTSISNKGYLTDIVTFDAESLKCIKLIGV